MRRFLQSWLRFRAQRVLLYVLLAALVLFGVFSQDLRVRMKYARAFQQRRMAPAEVHALPPNDLLPAFALGHRPFLADLIYIHTYMYFLKHLFTDRIYGWFDRYMGAIFALDPLNASAYLWAARMMKFGQQIDNRSIERSNRYAQRGIEHFPDDWRFYLELGFNHIFEYTPKDDLDGQRAKAEGIRYLSIASTLPGANIDPNLIAELYMRENSLDMALLYAYQLYFDASERERKSLRGRITLIEQRAVDMLDQLEARWKTHFPYVPIRFAPILGPPIESSSAERSVGATP